MASTALTVFVGAFTRPGGEGIYTLRFDPQRAELEVISVAEGVLDPTYLVVDPQREVLYSVGAIDLDSRDGLVTAQRIEADGRLREIDRRGTGGAAACHLAVDATRSLLVAANYVGGSICAVPLQPDGSFGDAVQHIQHTGSSVDPRRQTAPHPHSATFDPANRGVFVCDLGTDELLWYEIDAEREALRTPPASTAIQPGAGPRHLAFHPRRPIGYLINEMASTVTAFRQDAETGAIELRATSSTLPAGWTGSNTASAVRCSPSGDRLYVSNRGHDSIATYDIATDADEPALIGNQPSLGAIPATSP